MDKGGTIGLVNFGVDYFSTNERTKGVREWMQKNRPDIKMKQVDFTDPAESVADRRSRFPHRQSRYQEGVFARNCGTSRRWTRCPRCGRKTSISRLRPSTSACNPGDRDCPGRSAQGDRFAKAVRSGRGGSDGDDECADRQGDSGVDRRAVAACCAVGTSLDPTRPCSRKTRRRNLRTPATHTPNPPAIEWFTTSAKAEYAIAGVEMTPALSSAM